MAAVAVQITDTFLTPAGAADTGTATFWPVVPLRFTDTGHTVGASQVVGILDNAGTLLVTLTANDSPNIMPADTYWLVRFAIAHASFDTTQLYLFVLYAADAGTPVKLTTRLTDSLTLTPNVRYALQADLVAHSTTIASATVLGHIKSDEVTLHVNQTTGVASVIGGGGAGHTIQDEGSSLPGEVRLNFVGAGVTATDSPGTNATVVTIPGGGAPSGAAGGVLGGTYPNPAFAVDMATQAELDSEATARTAAAALALAKASNLSDLANAGTARTNLGLGTAAVTNTGTGATNTILGNDARLTDARTPTAHHTTHTTGGTDAIAPADIGAATSAALTSHTSNTSNPHSVTAAQAGAFATANNLSEGAAATMRGNLGLALVATLLGAVARVQQYLGGVLQGTRRGINLIAGTNVTITAADNAGTESVDFTINASGGGGGASAPLTLTLADSGTTTTPTIETLEHTTSGTAAAGFGAALDVKLEDSGGTSQLAVQLITAWRDASPSGYAALTSLWQVIGGGTPVERQRWGGVESDLGFVANVSDVSRFLDLGSEFRLGHHYQPSQSIDRWQLTSHPNPTTGLADATMSFGHLYGNPYLSLAQMNISFEDVGIGLAQSSGSHWVQWQLPAATAMAWEDGSFGAGLSMYYGGSYGFRVDAGGVTVFRISPTGGVQVSRDVAFSSSSVGPILADRTNGHTYRLFVDNGVLDIEMVT